MLTAAVCVGLAALTGSRGTIIGIALAFQLGVSPLLAQVEAIGDGRFAIPQVAIARIGGADDLGFAVAAAVAIVLAWAAAALAARRLAQRDAGDLGSAHEVAARRTGADPLRRRRVAVQHPVRAAALIPIYFARSRQMTIAGTVGVGLAMAAHDLIWSTEEPFQAYAISLALCVTAGVLGMYSGARRAAAARERELLAEAAAADERLRIARELHDAVGHDVSLMVVQAQALGATDERVREATDAIADLGRRTMADLHRTLRVLRGDEDAGRAPGAGLADLDELVELSRASGLPLTVVVDGTPRELEPMLDQSAYRIVQEAVTNVLKHADRAPTTITLGYGARRSS